MLKSLYRHPLTVATAGASLTAVRACGRRARPTSIAMGRCVECCDVGTVDDRDRERECHPAPRHGTEAQTQGRKPRGRPLRQGAGNPGSTPGPSTEHSDPPRAPSRREGPTTPRVAKWRHGIDGETSCVEWSDAASAPSETEGQIQAEDCEHPYKGHGGTFPRSAPRHVHGVRAPLLQCWHRPIEHTTEHATPQHAGQADGLCPSCAGWWTRTWTVGRKAVGCSDRDRMKPTPSYLDEAGTEGPLAASALERMRHHTPRPSRNMARTVALEEHSTARVMRVTPVVAGSSGRCDPLPLQSGSELDSPVGRATGTVSSSGASTDAPVWV